MTGRFEPIFRKSAAERPRGRIAGCAAAAEPKRHGSGRSWRSACSEPGASCGPSQGRSCGPPRCRAHFHTGRSLRSARTHIVAGFRERESAGCRWLRHRAVPHVHAISALPAAERSGLRRAFARSSPPPEGGCRPLARSHRSGRSLRRDATCGSSPPKAAARRAKAHMFARVEACGGRALDRCGPPLREASAR